MADPNTTRNGNGRLNNSVVPEGYERNVETATTSPAGTAHETRDGHAGPGSGAPNDQNYNGAGSAPPNNDTAHCLGGCQPTENGGFRSFASKYPQAVKDDDVEDGRGQSPPNGDSAQATAPSGNGTKK